MQRDHPIQTGDNAEAFYQAKPSTSAYGAQLEAAQRELVLQDTRAKALGKNLRCKGMETDLHNAHLQKQEQADLERALKAKDTLLETTAAARKIKVKDNIDQSQPNSRAIDIAEHDMHNNRVSIPVIKTILAYYNTKTAPHADDASFEDIPHYKSANPDTAVLNNIQLRRDEVIQAIYKPAVDHLITAKTRNQQDINNRYSALNITNRLLSEAEKMDDVLGRENTISRLKADKDRIVEEMVTLNTQQNEYNDLLDTIVRTISDVTPNPTQYILDYENQLSQQARQARAAQQPPQPLSEALGKLTSSFIDMLESSNAHHAEEAAAHRLNQAKSDLSLAEVQRQAKAAELHDRRTLESANTHHTMHQRNTEYTQSHIKDLIKSYNHIDSMYGLELSACHRLSHNNTVIQQLHAKGALDQQDLTTLKNLRDSNNNLLVFIVQTRAVIVLAEHACEHTLKDMAACEKGLLQNNVLSSSSNAATKLDSSITPQQSQQSINNEIDQLVNNLKQAMLLPCANEADDNLPAELHYTPEQIQTIDTHALLSDTMLQSANLISENRNNGSGLVKGCTELSNNRIMIALFEAMHHTLQHYRPTHNPNATRCPAHTEVVTTGDTNAATLLIGPCQSTTTANNAVITKCLNCQKKTNVSTIYKHRSAPINVVPLTYNCNRLIINPRTIGADNIQTQQAFASSKEARKNWIQASHNDYTTRLDQLHDSYGNYIGNPTNPTPPVSQPSLIIKKLTPTSAQTSMLKALVPFTDTHGALETYELVLERRQQDLLDLERKLRRSLNMLESKANTLHLTQVSPTSTNVNSLDIRLNPHFVNRAASFISQRFQKLGSGLKTTLGQLSTLVLTGYNQTRKFMLNQYQTCRDFISDNKAMLTKVTVTTAALTTCIAALIAANYTNSTIVLATML